MIDIASDSPTYEKLAHYIENYLRIIFMTAGELAKEAGISRGREVFHDFVLI